MNHHEAAIYTMEEFAQPGERKPELAYIAPSIDPLSVRNRPISEETIHEVMAAYGIDPERPISSPRSPGSIRGWTRSA